MRAQGNLCIDVRSVPPLEEAIDQWLAARDVFKLEPSDESQHEYNATLYDPEAEWRRWFPQHANTPGAFERYRRGLIAAEGG